MPTPVALLIIVGLHVQGLTRKTLPVGCVVKQLMLSGARKVDVRLPGEGNSNSYGARPVH